MGQILAASRFAPLRIVLRLAGSALNE